MDLMQLLAAIPGAGWLIPYVAAAVALAASLAAALPPPTGRGVYAVVYAIINAIACNFGHAKNQGAPE
jgi:hypothetical protein